MALKKIPSTIASERFSQIVSITASGLSLFDKLTKDMDRSNRNSASSVRSTLFGLVLDVMKHSNIYQDGAKPRDLLLYVIDIENAPSPLGETLYNDIQTVWDTLNSIKRNHREVTKDDYIFIIKVVSEFIAVLSGLPIPSELNDYISGVKPVEVLKEKENESDTNVTEKDLLDNPTTRVPVVLCLDVSASMTIDGRIEQLNKGVQEFFRSVSEDKIAKWAAEICIVIFNNEAKKLIDFNYVEKQKEAFDALELKAGGNTAMGAAVELSLSLLEQRKTEYRNKGIDYWQPWLVLMTDGQATDNIDKAADQCSKLVDDGKLVIFPLALGRGANLEELKSFSPKRAPLRLNEHKLSEFFNWLSQSVRTTSQSTPGATVKLPDVSSWAVL